MSGQRGRGRKLRVAGGLAALVGVLTPGAPPQARVTPPQASAQPPAATAAADAPAVATALAPGAVVRLRIGEHPGFTRLVFDLPPGAQPRLDPQSDGMAVRLPGAAFSTGRAGGIPGVTLADGVATLSWAPGTRLRQERLADRLVIDLLHPAATAALVAPPLARPGRELAAAAGRTAPPMPSPPPPMPVRAPATVGKPPSPMATARLVPTPAMPTPATLAPATKAPAARFAAASMPRAVGHRVAHPAFVTATAVAPRPALAAAPAPVMAPPAAAPPAVGESSAPALRAAPAVAEAASPPAPPASPVPAVNAPAPALAAAAAPTTPVTSTPVGPPPAADAAAPPLAAAAPPTAPPSGTAPAVNTPAPALAGATPTTAAPAAPTPAADMAAPTLAAAAPPAGPTPVVDAAAPAADAPRGAPGYLTFPHGTGAAAFRRGGWGIAVFDDPRPLDLTALHADPKLAAAHVDRFAAATEVRVALAPDQALSLVQRRDGWSMAVVSGVPGMRAIHPMAAAGHLVLGMDRPGRVVSVPDPDTGGLLMVGTQGPLPSWALRAAEAAAARSAGGGPGGGQGALSPQGVPVERRTPLFALLATWQGVAVEPDADDLVLRDAAGGFSLERTAAGQALSLAAADGTDRIDAAAAFSRLFDLPDASLIQLRRRLAAATGMAAAQPPQGRGPARLRAAEAMLALGMGAEAAGLVHLAETDDPRLVANPQAEALAGAANLLAGRVAEATGLADPALTGPGAQGADEAMLWRALLAARHADAALQTDPAAAQMLAVKLPLLESYPAPLRDRLLPLALRTMVLGGEAAAAQHALDAQPKDNPPLDYVRAMLAEQNQHMPDALAAMDRLARTRNDDISARAAVQAVDIRLAAHALTPAQAADALDPLIYAWRGDNRELAVRLQEAALRAQAGQPRQALALLRESANPVLLQGWPDRRAEIAAKLHDTFAEAVSRDAGQPMPPLDFVAMVQENADLLPSGAAGQALAERVSDRLAALDLPDQAAAALGQLVDTAPPGAARGTLGARLAALQMEQHDPQSALMSLSASTGEGLPPGLVETRTLLFARATAARGNLNAATGALEALGTPAAEDLEAKLLADAGKWAQATAALQRVVSRTLPATGMLDAAQSGLLLRLASAAAQAGDGATLAELRDTELARVPPGKAADLLRVLTEGPVQTVADLPRSGAEMALARSALK